MTLRVIVRTTDASMVAHVDGGTVDTWFETFDIEAPALEACLRDGRKIQYGHAQVVGVELLSAAGEP